MTQKRRLAWALALLFVVNIAVISLAQQAEAATYRQGSSGEQVLLFCLAPTRREQYSYYHEHSYHSIHNGRFHHSCRSLRHLPPP